MSMARLLDTIDSPQDLKRLAVEDLPKVCQEIRDEIIETCSRNGGHLGSSLGAVEINVALHYVFDSPRDRLVWDVGHQAYAHKLLTGRRDRFRTIRTPGGLAGQVLGLDHAQRRRDGGGGVAHAEGVVLRLVPLREAGQAALGPDGAEPVAPAGQQLVGVGLVADVPDQLVGRRGEDVVERDVQLHRPQRGPEVAAVGGAGLDDLVAQLRAELREVAHGELLQVGRRVDRVEQAAHDRLLLHFFRSRT
jgi:hypothetical protein